ncbi:MAG: S8 family serine peptidase, partial [Verrucomicrobia bacterium]|nr:S8 family serine peptidase [Verrucomicrobiota bacterium]
MKNRQTLSAVLLTALVAGLAYLGISRGPVTRQPAPALGQAPAVAPQRLAKPVAVALPQTAPADENPFPFRLRNTGAPIGDLVRNETAVLLRNAFIDTALGQALPIPAELKADGDPLTYIAQARGPATAAFRRHIGASGGTIISYIPNNAYLVRVDAAGAARLANWPGTQSVLPFEPYYKLEMKLLEMALTGRALPEGALLNVVLFPESEPAVAQRLAKLGVEVLAQDRTPFGAKLVARVPGGKLAALARLTGVQGLERHRPRRLANDLTRPRLGVEVYTVQTNAAGAVTNVMSEDHLDLTGQGIYVNVNDTGVDDSHAAFGNRIKGPATSDSNGHGTFVAGIIAGDGAGSDTIKTNPPPGSLNDPDFKGMAPKAKLHVLRSGDRNANNHVSDRWLQTESATYNYDRKSRVNVLISNNSWEYDEENDYTWAAASYDAATRDALPERPGDQQVIYVFPAGNSGAGSVNGLNASPNSVSAPGTAKNVITVGAIETLREIAVESKSYETNTVTETDEDGNEVTKEEVTTTTNTPFASQTDSDNQVTYFSSRGNVGIGIEGQYGRFKPDLVAPGAFIISTKTSDWDDSITTTTNTLNGDEAYVYGGWRHRSEERAEARRELDEQLGDQYRYGSGTSVAAPAISGMLALMQEFYTGRLKRTNSPALLKALLINSAASVDARYDHNVRGAVNHQGWGLPNLGRAVPALADDNRTDEAAWPMRFIDQSLTNALATGESRSWEITLGTNALHYPLRFTLAWTDPPGNPNAAVKLVNDLDLIVTPLSHSSLGQGGSPDSGDPGDPNDPGGGLTGDSGDTNEVYYGNNIGASVFSSMGVTNDVINNVENVFIEEPSAEQYRVTVYARRVNVDSLSAFYDTETPANHVDVVQDFALVMSSANPEVGGAFEIRTDKPEAIDLPPIASLTNGLPMLHQRVGANSALAKTNDPAHTVYANRRGITNQWHFYTFTNAPPQTTNQSGSTPGGLPTDEDDDNKPKFGKHVAFITFMPPNLSTPRSREADIDLYVSRDPALLDLDPSVLDAAFRSTERGGTEFVTFDDAKVADDEVFYIGVKSEDQMAAEYGLVGLSTDDPNGFMDPDGNLTMMPLPAIIPDGSASNPGGVSVFGIYAGMPYDYVRKVTASSTIFHQEIGDLWGQLSHVRDAVVLNNHTLADPLPGEPYPTDFLFQYDDDDNPSRVTPGSIFTDGPGSLNDFKWQPAMGVWQVDMVDSALAFTG